MRVLPFLFVSGGSRTVYPCRAKSRQWWKWEEKCREIALVIEWWREEETSKSKTLFSSNFKKNMYIGFFCGILHCDPQGWTILYLHYFLFTSSFVNVNPVSQNFIQDFLFYFFYCKESKKLTPKTKSNKPKAIHHIMLL